MNWGSFSVPIESVPAPNVATPLTSGCGVTERDPEAAAKPGQGIGQGGQGWLPDVQAGQEGQQETPKGFEEAEVASSPLPQPDRLTSVRRQPSPIDLKFHQTIVDLEAS